MVQAIPVSDLTLRQVKQQFGLVPVNDAAIAEWQLPFPDFSDLERQVLECQVLDRVQANFADLTVFGLATNGREFLFIQLMPGQTPQYALSRRFSMDNPEQALHAVLSILKRIGTALLP
jgi:hypothetical protein